MRLDGLEEPEGWPSDASADRLIGDWSIYQRAGGHRSSTDDVLTSWAALRASRGAAPTRYLDLGCGVGSVLLTVCHRLRPARSLGVEAQPQSVTMLRRALDELPVGAPPVSVQQQDFRSFQPSERFELITGSPPYFPLGTGVLPDDSQRRACRFELRGGVEDYCATAARCLAPGGAFVLVFQTVGDARVRAAASNAGLHLAARIDARMRTDRPEPFLTVYELRAEPAATVERVEVAVRGEDGEFSAAYRRAREELGFTP